MKNFGKKTLVLVLVLVLALSLVALVACNKKDTSTPEEAKTPLINTAGADDFINWMGLASTRNTLIATYGTADYGETLFTLLADAPTYNGTLESLQYSASKYPKNEVRISTTTSVNDTGLLGFLGTKFEEQTGWKILVTSAGTGKAIQNAKDGNADLILVHAKAQEEAFVADGYGRKVTGYTSERISFMYNFFVLAGPHADPAGVKTATSVTAGFQAIKNTASPFVSRGDNSGTHTKEINLWKLAGETEIGWDADLKVAKYPASYTWYTAAAAGMTASLQLANENNAYILSDKGTYLKNKNGATDAIPNLEIVCETDNDLKNTYTMIAVNPDKF